MGFDWKIGLKKFAVNAGIVVGAGIISVYGENPAWLAFIPLIKFGMNWLKHRK